MPKKIPKPNAAKPGRKENHPVDELRTQLWYRVVEARSGLTSPHFVELELEPRLRHASADGVSRPSKYRKYSTGKRVPPRIPGKANSVDVAEARYPGTAWYFNTPMWEVVKKQKLPVETIDAGLRDLGSAIDVTLLDAKVSPEGTRRFKEFDKHHSDVLVGLGTFQAFAAAVLLIAKSEAIGNPALRELAFETYYRLQSSIEAQKVFAPLTEELFRFIDLACKFWIFPTSQSRMEVVVFSNELRAHVDGLNAAAASSADSNVENVTTPEDAPPSQADDTTPGMST
jgi:hypothetical protein